MRGRKSIEAVRRYSRCSSKIKMRRDDAKNKSLRGRGKTRNYKLSVQKNLRLRSANVELPN